MENLFYIDVSRFDEERNKIKLKMLRDSLKTTSDVEKADYILAVGGDGCLLNSISNFKHLNIPFFGINGGTLGYYMQELKIKDNKISLQMLEKIKYADLNLVEMPLLNVIATNKDNEIYQDTAFGDIWIERREAQSLKYNISVQTETVPLFCSKNKFISGDGILFSTAAGSTGYARNILGVVMPIGTKDMLVAPIHSTVDKRKLNGFTLNNKSTIKIEIYDIDFRIPRINVDGRTLKNKDGTLYIPLNVQISSSNKTVKLAYTEKNYLEYKSFDYLIN